MKNFFVLLLSLAMCVSVVACSSNSETSGSSNDSSSLSTSDNITESNQNTANIEIIQDGSTLIATLTGDIVSFTNEQIENGQEIQLTVQFDTESRESLGSFMLLSTDDGYTFKQCYDFGSGESFDMDIAYSSEKVIFSCSDCPIDFAQVGYVSAYAYADEDLF